MVKKKNIKIKTFAKNQKTRKTELGWIAQDAQQYTNPKYNIANDSGEYLTMCYDRMACISWDALSKLIHRVEYLENELFKNKNKKTSLNNIYAISNTLNIKELKKISY